MRKAVVRTVCECQADLEAVLDEKRLVLDAWAISTGNSRERAPAHTIKADQPFFDIGWLCPFCGRNTLRSFSADALAFRTVEADEAAAAKTEDQAG